MFEQICLLSIQQYDFLVVPTLLYATPHDSKPEGTLSLIACGFDVNLPQKDPKMTRLSVRQSRVRARIIVARTKTLDQMDHPGMASLNLVLGGDFVGPVDQPLKPVPNVLAKPAKVFRWLFRKALGPTNQVRQARLPFRGPFAKHSATPLRPGHRYPCPGLNQCAKGGLAPARMGSEAGHGRVDHSPERGQHPVPVLAGFVHMVHTCILNSVTSGVTMGQNGLSLSIASWYCSMRLV